MYSESTYVVFPQAPTYWVVVLSEYDKKRITDKVKNQAWLIWIVFSIVTGGITLSIGYAIEGMTLPIYASLIYIIAGLIISASVTLVIALQRRDKLITESEQKQNRDAYWREVERVNRNAESLTGEIRNIYHTAVEAARQIRDHLNQASAWLRNAEDEYNSSAFDPYWTAVENASRHLAECSQKTNNISHNAQRYYEKLKGQRHTFPSFPIHPESLPNAGYALGDFQRVVRLGQTNFQFANIWEHRRTREVLIAGFHTLGEAVNNLGTTIENSIFSLQQSTSSDVARLVEAEISTRQTLDQRAVEQNRMLDNIQSHRKPDALDRPSRY